MSLIRQAGFIRGSSGSIICRRRRRCGGGWLLRNCHPRGQQQPQLSSLSVSSLAVVTSSSSINNRSSSSWPVLSFSSSASSSSTHHDNGRDNAARRQFSISRHPDPLIRHGNINTLDDNDDDVGDNNIDGELDATLLGGGGNTASTKKVLLTADDYEFMDDILNWGAEEEEENVLGKKSKKKHQQSQQGDEDSYNDIFGNLDEDLGLTRKGGNDDGDDGNDQDPETLAYHARQAQIKASLDSRTTGRLWKTSWNITDEEWMTDEEWDDIEEWKPTLATRKSLESVRVYEDDTGSTAGVISGVPTLQSLAELRLPNPLPQHPGYGNPSVYATYRRRRITEKIRSSVVRAAREDVAKMVHPAMTNEQRRYMVDELYECIVDKVRVAEPVLGKLPDFAKFVELALEEVLITVRSRAMKLERDAIKKMKEQSGNGEKEEMEMGEKEGEGGNKANDRISSKSSSSKSSPAVNEHAQFVNSVMEVLDEYETPTPIFMDILAATRNLEVQHRNQRNGMEEAGGGDGSVVVGSSLSIPKFFASSNESGVPNLLYPLTVHPKEGVGRMVEEWQLAANKETKRIMMRDAMRDVARAIVDATTSSTGAARVFVAGKRGVGKVRFITMNCNSLSLSLSLSYAYTILFTLASISPVLPFSRISMYRLPRLLASLHRLESLVTL